MATKQQALEALEREKVNDAYQNTLRNMAEGFRRRVYGFNTENPGQSIETLYSEMCITTEGEEEEFSVRSIQIVEEPEYDFYPLTLRFVLYPVSESFPGEDSNLVQYVAGLSAKPFVLEMKNFYGEEAFYETVEAGNEPNTIQLDILVYEDKIPEGVLFLINSSK